MRLLLFLLLIYKAHAMCSLDKPLELPGLQICGKSQETFCTPKPLCLQWPEGGLMMVIPGTPCPCGFEPYTQADQRYLAVRFDEHPTPLGDPNGDLASYSTSLKGALDDASYVQQFSGIASQTRAVKIGTGNINKNSLSTTTPVQPHEVAPSAPIQLCKRVASCESCGNA